MSAEGVQHSMEAPDKPAVPARPGDLATPSADSLSLLARSALHAKLAGYQGNKPSSPTDPSTEAATKSDPPAKKEAIGNPNAPPPTSSVEAGPSKPAVNGATARATEKKSSDESSEESSSSDSDSSSEAESNGEEKDDKQVVTATAKTVKPVETTEPAVMRRKRGRPPGSRSAPTTPADSKPSRAARSGGHSVKRQRPAHLAADSPRQQPADAEAKTPASKSIRRGRGCGKCPGCMREDCGKCMYCEDKPKFGGPGVKKQRCSLRACSNFVSQRSTVSATQSRRRAQEAALLTRTGDSETPPESGPPPPQGTPKVSALESSIAKKELAPALSMLAPGVSQGTPGQRLIASTASAPITTVATDTPTTTTASVPAVASKPSAKKAAELAVETKMSCIQCGRERKLTLAKSEKFCTQRCLLQWMDDHPERTLQQAISSAPPTATTATDSSGDTVKKARARELKNLYIDMALPGTTLGEPVTSPPATNPISPPTLGPSPKPVTSTPLITTRSSTRQSTGGTQLPSGSEPKTSEGKGEEERGRKPSERIAAAMAGTKRATPPTSQPTAVKKPKQDSAESSTPPIIVTTVPSKSVTFHPASITIPVSTVQPISAPPLSRTVPPPSISIVPLDQLTALGSALLKQQKLHQTQQKQMSRKPNNLPDDVRKWTIAQVVSFFRNTPDCKEFADIFREQEVDGTALLLMTHESLVKCLGIKLGRALKIMLHVETLRVQQENF